MRAVKDLQDIAPEQIEPIPFDVGDYLPPGVTLTGTPTITCWQSGAWKTGAIDASAAARLVGSATIVTVAKPDGSGRTSCAATRNFSLGVDGVTYTMKMVCARTDGGTAELHVNMRCVAAPVVFP